MDWEQIIVKSKRLLILLVSIVLMSGAFMSCASNAETPDDNNNSALSIGNIEDGGSAEHAEQIEQSNQENDNDVAVFETGNKQQYPFETGIAQNGYKQYLGRNSVGITTDWNNINLGASYTVEYNIMLPSEYDFSSNIIHIDGQKFGEIWPFVKLQENQTMPTSHDDVFVPEDMRHIIKYYDSELFSVHDITVSLARASAYLGNEESGLAVYAHAFYMTIDEYVVTITFYPVVEYPEQEVLDTYIEIITSVEIV